MSVWKIVELQRLIKVIGHTPFVKLSKRILATIIFTYIYKITVQLFLLTVPHSGNTPKLFNRFNW